MLNLAWVSTSTLHRMRAVLQGELFISVAPIPPWGYGNVVRFEDSLMARPSVTGASMGRPGLTGASMGNPHFTDEGMDS